METVRFALRLALAVIAFVVQPGLGAAKDGEMSAELAVHKVLRSAAGAETLASAEGAGPGDVVEYRAVYTNRGTVTVMHYEGTLPIPPWAQYLPGSASPPLAAASLDGRVYAAVPLTREVTRSGGRKARVEIPATEYRYLRWNLGDLAPGGRAEAVFRVRVVSSGRPAPPGAPAR